MPTDPTASPTSGDEPRCAPDLTNSSALAAVRNGTSYADANGNLRIERVPDATDTTHQFTDETVALSTDYGVSAICTSGGYPSGHTTKAYQAGITLATLLPELAPEILARASEAGNNRIVLGVHSPLDVIGGRIVGQAASAARWSDPIYRSKVLEPARTELITYLENRCGGTVAGCAARGDPYQSNPYGGRSTPADTDETVTDRASAVSTYQSRLTYGFSPIDDTSLPPSVPAGAANLLLTTFPTLSEEQRTSVLAQTQLASGYPLDLTVTGGPAWQRLNLAAAMSATVRINHDGTVTVTNTGGQASVLEDPDRLKGENTG
ncbi:phosphatase PAP2 family protein (plasmid) [Leifsonia sp. ZF2019]|nr:phosphatase PAP2 family protein [Leifsonia sp. ZF2019]